MYEEKKEFLLREKQENDFFFASLHVCAKSQKQGTKDLILPLKSLNVCLSRFPSGSKTCKSFKLNV